MVAEVDILPGPLIEQRASESPYLLHRFLSFAAALSVALVLSFVIFRAYKASYYGVMTKGRLSPDDPTSYARIGELELTGWTNIFSSLVYGLFDCASSAMSL